MEEILKVGDVVLPAPDLISTTDEIIWSSNTGRTADATMVGDILAEKKTLSITWGILKEEQYLVIKNNLVAGFFPITFHDDGMDLTISSYRGNLSKDIIGKLDDGIFYYRSVSCEIIQQ